jgi:predicted alpha/beta superfamily hydrolase
MSWRPYEASPSSTVTGDLRFWSAFESPQLGNTRDLLVWLPPSYDRSAARYPVLYMHDGQNLFDAATSFSGEWRVDESMADLAAEGLEAIVVGLPNTDGQPLGGRLEEYSPFPSDAPQQPEGPRRGGRGDAYASFLVETLKPVIDRDFRTLPDRATTGVAGSSMGGFISLYALYAYPEVFGFAGVFSPHYPFSARLYDFVARAPDTPAAIYTDVGDAEWGDPEADAAYVRAFGRMADILKGKRVRLRAAVVPGGVHHESAWAERFPDAVRWWLASPADI